MTYENGVYGLDIAVLFTRTGSKFILIFLKDRNYIDDKQWLRYSRLCKIYWLRRTHIFYEYNIIYLKTDVRCTAVAIYTDASRHHYM